MKIKRIILGIIIAILCVTFGAKIFLSLAANEKKYLKYSPFRYVYSSNQQAYVPKNGYAINSSSHTIYQILSRDKNGTITGTEYYCLDADVPIDETTDNTENYDNNYNMNTDKSDIENLSSSAYSNIAKNKYTQIMWVLDNIYIQNKDLTDSQNLENKKQLFTKAGIKYGNKVISVDPDITIPCYMYEKGTEDYTNIAKIGKNGYFYYDEDKDEFTTVEMPDDLVSAVQQAVLWYFSNGTDSVYDNYNYTDWLKFSNGTDEENSTRWMMLGNYHATTSGTDNAGEILQEEATILYHYLIDAANEYASKNPEYAVEKNPLTISSTTNIDAGKLDGYYIVGPIKISEEVKALYKLDKLLINDNENSAAYISDVDGNNINKTLNDVVGEDFYISIPKSSITTDKIKIKVSGEYNSNSKTLWVSSQSTRQPAVEVRNATLPINLEVESEIPTSVTVKKEWDDANNQDGLRDENTTINIKLFADGQDTGKSLVLPNNNQEENKKWTGTFDNLPVTSNGNVITYSVKEQPVLADYNANETKDATYSFTITNTHTPKTTTISGTKTWVDYENKDNTRPESIIVRLLADGEEVQNKEVKATDNWNYEFTGLPVNKAGNKIIYTIKEDKVNNYDTTINGYNITNTYKTTTKVEGTKTWIDYENKDNTRPESITVNLLKNGTKVDSKVVTAANGWKYEFTNLDKYDENNNLILYTVTEDKVNNYDTTINGYNITNTYKTTTKVEGTKTWIDYENKDNTRPESITVNLLKNGTKVDSKVVTAANGWKYEFTNLDKYDENNNLILYTVTEDKVNNYDTTINGYNITNTYKTTTKVEGTKTWIDYENKDNTRPESITVNLLKNGTKVDSKVVTAANGWKYEFTNLDKYDENNNLITYTITEDKVDNYETTISGYNITNTNKIFDLSLRKFITQVGGQDLQNARIPEVKEDSLTTGTTATYNHRKDPVVVETNSVVKYSIRIYNEGEKKGYASQIIDQLPAGLEFVEKTTVTSKDSNGANKNTYSVSYDKDTNRITFNISGTPKDLNEYTQGNLDYETLTFECKVTCVADTKDNIVLTNVAWINKAHDSENNKDATDRDSKTEIPNVESNQEVNKNNTEDYQGDKDNKIDLADKDNYYKGQEDDDDFEKLVVEPRISINVEKVWDDNNDQDKIRPDSVSITLYANNEEVETITLNKDNNWKHRFTGLPLKANGQTITYKVDEKNVPTGYEKTVTGSEVVGYTAKNTHAPQEIKTVDLALTKFITAISQDESIEDGEYLTANKKIGSKENPYIRQTSVDTTALKAGTATTATYNQVKTPLEVEKNSYVLYNIRVYNEGETNCYAGEIRDYLPDGLEAVDGTFNASYGWEISTDKRTLRTKYLSSTNGTDKMLKAFDKENDDNAGSGLDYKDVPILCKVSENAQSETNIVNSAEITKYEAENGDEIDQDEDSKPKNIEEKNKEKRYEDDDDYEVIKVKPEPEKIKDLALTKFIAAISQNDKIEDGKYLTADKKVGSKENPYIRQTSVDTKDLKNGTSTNAKYTQVKDPLQVDKNSYVLYNIRVYNEGEVDCYAGEVSDYLPEYLEFVQGEFNNGFGWEVSQDGRTVKTKYLSFANGTDKILKAFNKENDDGKGSKLDYKDLQILCKVKDTAPGDTRLVNSAEITKYENEKGEEFKEDVDSKSDNLEGKNKEKRNEDDDDFEVVKVTPEKKIDLALTKFIAAVSNDVEITDGEYLTPNGNKGSKENPYSRATKVDTTKLRDDPSVHDATYTLVKDPLTVPAKSYVLYNIRIYNEGETDCYAGEVLEHLPEYLDYVEGEFNNNFGWKVAQDGKTISTSILSQEKGTENKLKAFDKQTDDGQGSGLDYRDLQILCKVNDNAPSKTNIVNVAEISKYEDEDGKDVTEDVDSKPKNVDTKNEDDDDYDTVLVKTFDLSLIKYVSKVIVTEDGVTKESETGNTGNNSTDMIPKVEIHRKKLDSTSVKFAYTIRITNEGDVEGFAKEITDYVPEGLEFSEEDNTGWTNKGNRVIATRALEDTLIEPGESKDVTVIFRWIQGKDNLGLKTNIAEISEDYNKEGIQDRDSTPGNKKFGEDDIDTAEVLLAISTGIKNNAITYITIGSVILIVLATGIISIKKYVL